MEMTRKRWIQIFVVAALLVVLVCVYSLRQVLWPFIIAFFIAYIFNPWVNFFQRKGAPRLVGITLVFLLLVGIIVAFAFLVIPPAAQEISDAAKKLPAYIEVLRARTTPWLQQLRLDHPEISKRAEEYFNNNLKQKIPVLLAPVFDFLGRMFSGVVNFLLVMLNILLIPVLAFYMLKDFPQIKDRIYELVPPRQRDRVRGRIAEVDQALSEYLRGQLTVSLALAFIYTVGLLFLRVPLAIPIGIFSGLANMVPYLGIVLGISFSMLMSFVDNQEWQRLVWIVALYTFAQLMEGTWIGPLVVGKRTGLHPVVIMLALVIGGTLFGFMGMLLAVPFMAVASVFIKAAYDAYRTSLWYQEEQEQKPQIAVIEQP